MDCGPIEESRVFSIGNGTDDRQFWDRVLTSKGLLFVPRGKISKFVCNELRVLW